MELFSAILVIGVGATIVMDVWGVVRSLLFAMPLPSYALVGRWLAHMLHGKFRHDAIAAAKPVVGEQFIGWSAHYLTGIAYAAILVGIYGQAWLQSPTLVPAVLIGVVTLLAPFLLMQPGIGLGVAASRAPNPAIARLHSFLNHAVFGLGLYVSARLMQLAL